MTKLLKRGMAICMVVVLAFSLAALHRNEEKFFDNEAINFAVTDSEQFQQQRQFIQEERNRCF